jgi:ATP-dependent helicase/nuclease subunit B
VRELSRIFLELGGNGAAILPRIRPIGDVDEHEFILSRADELDPAILPAIAPAVRQFLLARLINEWADAHPETGLARALLGFPGQVFALARSLGNLVDSFETEEISLDEIERLMGADFPEHRLAMLDFLAIVRKRLPEELARRGLIGRAARRSLLLSREAADFERHGSDGPVIAAGSTGSIRATAKLLRVVARLEEGAVVLPGLDLDMDEASWQSIAEEPGHPQHGLKQLLSVLGVDRKEVSFYPGSELAPAAEARLWLASEMMRPSETSDLWWPSLARRSDDIRAAMQGVELIEAADQREEARVIATIMRRSLELEGRNIRLITPSRRLARRVRAELRRWSIELADLAGEPCSQTQGGAFLRLLLELGLSRFSPLEFAQLLKHPFFRLSADRPGFSSLLCNLEIALLRGAIEPKGLFGLRLLLAERMRAAMSGERPRGRLHSSLARLTGADWRGISDFVERFAAAASPFLDLMAQNRQASLETFIRTHLQCAEALTSSGRGLSLLWQGEEGEVLSDLFADLLGHAAEAPALSPADYAALVTGELAARVVRPSREDHPRLAIMGLLEARLLHSDSVILAGLNHGLWPAEAEIDPWLSRPMKAQVNLSSPDRRIGLSAHDFVHSFLSPAVYITYSRKIDGVPTVPSRWITRLEAVLNAGCEPRPALSRSSPWLAWAAELDRGETRKTVSPPRPKPPLAARPRILSVTRVEKLINNPYLVFAENILGLEPLDPLSKRLSAADRGSLVHEALHDFAKSNATVAEDALDRLLAAGHAIFSPWFYDPQVQAFWWPQFQRIAQWFIDHERAWRRDCHCQHCEIDAASVLAIGGTEFTITARADRIDARADGTMRIIDYKTGQLPSLKAVDEGFAPQLPLEAWLAAQGAFSGCPACEVSELIFVRLTGGQTPGEIRLAGNSGPAELARAAHQGLLKLLSGYASPDTPYLALDVDDSYGSVGDVYHLARTREWLNSAESGGEPP